MKKVIDDISDIYGAIDEVSQSITEVIKILHHYVLEDIKNYGEEDLEKYPAYVMLNKLDEYDPDYFENDPSQFEQLELPLEED